MIPLVAVAAAVGIDRTAFGQTMLAHPLVAATLGGWLAGAPAEGFWLGATLTLLSLAHVPVGETRLRDWSNLSLAGGYALAGRSPAEAGAILLVLVLLARPAGHAILAVRAFTLRLRESVDPVLAAGRHDGLPWIQLLGLLAHALRGIVVTALAVFLLDAAADRVGALDARLGEGLARLWALAAILGVPLLYRLHLAPRLLTGRRRG